MNKACYSFQEDISIEVGISKKTNFWQDKLTGFWKIDFWQSICSL